LPRALDVSFDKDQCRSSIASAAVNFSFLNKVALNWFKYAKTQKRKNAKTQKRKNAKTQKRKNAKMQKCKNAKMQKCKNAKM